MPYDFDDDQILADIQLLESEDPKLLKQMIHPFQLLKSKPVLLMLSFFPKHLQSLYRQLFLVDNQSFLPFPHLLIEFLFHAREFEPYTLRFSVLLTILLPIFQEHKMENFLLAFIKQCRRDKDYLKKISKENSCKIFTKILLKNTTGFISAQITIEDAIEEERRRLSIASNTTDGSNQLYVSSVCLARLIRVLDEKTKMPVKAMINEALIAVKKIENPLWRLDALLAISKCPDTTRSESSEYILELENVLTSSTSFLGGVALIVRCLLTSKTKFKSKRLFDKIFEQLHLQSDNNQQTICETLAQFPSLHSRVCHFIRRKTKWINGDSFDIFHRIFLLHSSECATPFSAANSSSYLYQTLAASMYLSELSIDIIKLEDWFLKTISANDTSSRQPCIAVPELGKACLHALQRDRSFVSTEIVFNLSTYFAYFAAPSISHTTEDHVHLQALERALEGKKLEDAESANNFVLKWLSYKHHSFLYHCAHIAAELLAISDMQSSEIIEECCEILVGREYRHCPGVASRIIRNWQESDEKFFEILLEYLIREDYAERLPLHLYNELHERLQIHSSQEFKLLIDAERKKYHKTTEKENVSTSQWSLFELIRTWPVDALQYFMDVLLSVTTVTTYPFLAWLLEHIPTEVISDSTEKERFCEYLFSILVDECIHASLKLVIIQRLSYYQEDHRVRIALWNIIQSQSKDDDLLVIACLRSLYWRYQVNLNEEELKQLHLLRKCSSFSNELQQAVLTGLYMNIIREPECYSVFEVYICYMMNIGNDNGDILDEEYQNDIAQRASDWIISHRSILLGKFVEDLCKRINPLLTDVYAYIYVADLIGGKLREKLCDVIRENTMGESCFRSSLCLACQTKLTENNGHINHCVQVYAYFHEFTCDYASMLLKLKDDHLLRKVFRSISLYKIDREVIDFLLNLITSTFSSHHERFCAGQLLLRLEESGYVSIVEIQETIISAIEKYGSENNQSDCDLKRLLFQRMQHDLSDPEEFPNISQSSVASLTVTPCTAAPAVVVSNS